MSQMAPMRLVQALLIAAVVVLTVATAERASAEPPTRIFVSPVSVYGGSLAPMDANVVRIQLATRLMRLPGVIVLEASAVDRLLDSPQTIGCSDRSERCFAAAATHAGADVVVSLAVDAHGELSTSLTITDTDHPWSQHVEWVHTDGDLITALRENLADQVDNVEDWLDDGPEYRWRHSVMYPDSFWSGPQVGWIPWGTGGVEYEGYADATAGISDDTRYNFSLLMFYHFDVVSFGFAFWWFPSVGVTVDDPSELAPTGYNGTVVGASSDDELDYNGVIEFYGEPGRWLGASDLDELVLVLDVQGGFTHWVGDSDSDNAIGANAGAGLGIQWSPDDVIGLRLTGRYQLVAVEQDKEIGNGKLDVDVTIHRAMMVFSFVGTD